MVITVTGHRPQKLFGFNDLSPEYLRMKEYFKDFLIENKCTEAITGMALGVDQVFAQAVLELKEEDYDIKLHCAIPCKNHSCKWPLLRQMNYEDILKQSDEVTLVTDEEYSPKAMQTRNEYMVDRADLVVAVWNGSRGGTYNCIKYAEKHNKDIIIVEPNDFIL